MDGGRFGQAADPAGGKLSLAVAALHSTLLIVPLLHAICNIALQQPTAGVHRSTVTQIWCPSLAYKYPTVGIDNGRLDRSRVPHPSSSSPRPML